MIRVRAKSFACFLLSSAALLLLPRIYAQDAPCTKDSRPDCPRAVIFFRSFQASLAKNDREGLARMVEYPLRARLNHKAVQISTPAMLLRHFDEIFDKAVRCEISEASDKDVWGNWQGFTIKDGAVWFDQRLPPGEKFDAKSPDIWTKGSFKLITVNNDSYYTCLDSGKSGE
jgi:hypothetical protein